MEPLNIDASNETPLIEFDGSTGKFLVSGKSYPENVNSFYHPVFEYIEMYRNKPQPKTILIFNWLYYNTSTAKIIVKIIMQLKDLSPEFEVRWHCRKDNDLLIEKGNEIKEVLDLNLEIIFSDIDL